MKVLICDDQAIVRDGLAALLRLVPDIKVTGTAEDEADRLRRGLETKT